MKIQVTNWAKLHRNTKRKLFKLMLRNGSGMRAAIEYHDYYGSHSDNSITIGRNKNGRIVGWAYACSFFDGVYVMTYVDPRHRKRGYGSALVKKLIHAYAAHNGPVDFYANCIKTRFFLNCGVKSVTDSLPVCLSWENET